MFFNKNSAENLSEVSLELGGKSPVAVFDDAEQENAINGITAGIFGASGQSCIAGSRLYIQKGIYDEFLEKLSKRASKIKIGAPMASETNYWKKYTGTNGLNFGINEFGKSAPYKEIYDHFKLNSESIVKKIKEKL